MPDNRKTAPAPILKIVPKELIFPHEEHDPQRSMPLIKIIQDADVLTNPPIVAPMGDGSYVLLDGANRYFTLCHIGYEHILVQVVEYESEFVELGVWNHIISDWDIDEFIHYLEQYPSLELAEGDAVQAIAEVYTRGGRLLSIKADVESVRDRNKILRDITHMYQQNCTLYRTASMDTQEIFQLYEDAVAIIIFPEYHPTDIIEAAKEKAYLPPGVSRHIIHGRVLKLNYPFEYIRDSSKTLEEKNEFLQDWLAQKRARRGMRYYAEGTYQFDE